jgi:hypothetical protein
MASWSVVIWAVVTPDLEDVIGADLKEAGTALDAFGLGNVLHVHVVLSRPGGVPLQVVSWPAGSHDPGLANAKSLQDVTTAATCWGDATHRILVVWGHGARAFPSGRSATTLYSVGVAVPTAEELGSSWPTGVAKPDIIGYDACRMATVSSVLWLAEFFPDAYFVGSMVPEPASGWPYFEFLRILREPWGPRPVASAIVEAYAASVDSADWCMVALELGAVKDPTSGARFLANDLSVLLGSPARSAGELFSAAQGADIQDDTNLVDLGALMRRLEPWWLPPPWAPPPAPPPPPPPAAIAVRNRLTNATVARRASGSLAGRDGVALLVEVPPDGVITAPWLDPTLPWDEFTRDTATTVTHVLARP